MNKRTIGTLFCCVAAVLFVTRYLFAFWYIGHFNQMDWTPKWYADAMSYVGIGPWVAAGVFLLLGLIFLFRSDPTDD